jgi:hypothetical protein
MTTGYTGPLGAAYGRMKASLFRPFNLDKWIPVAFASWISGWSSTSGGSFNYRFPGSSNGKLPSTPQEAIGKVLGDMAGLWADPMWRAVLIATAVVIVALGVLILWINSRGEFVFLDVVLHGRRAIVEPWHAGRVQGNSLFVFRLVFGLIMLSAFVIALIAVFLLAAGGRIPHSASEVPWLRILIGFGIVWVPFVLAGLYVDLFLRHFVTPIMFRDRSTTMEAWRTFLPILQERLGSFFVYGLFVLVVHIGLFLALIPAILLTCCLLGCLLIIPFISAVVWLPVSYTFRALGPEFLAQFGPAYNVRPLPVVAPETPPELPGELPS